MPRGLTIAAGVLTVLTVLTVLSVTSSAGLVQSTPAPKPLASRPPVGTVRRRAASWSTPITQSKSGLWVWVQCAGKDDIKHNYAATPALWLLHAAAHLDLNVMFCDMPPSDGIPAEYLQRAVSLPPALRKLVTENEPMVPRRYLELLSKVTTSFGTPCTFMYAIMITPIVAVGNSPEIVAENLRQLLIYRTPHFAVVPRVMHRTP
jgi:hypothetical protein